MTDSERALDAAITEGPDGPAEIALLCEHGSRAIPAPFRDLGLHGAARDAHIAWDPGALAVSRLLSAELRAPLVSGGVSRLIYDCNRPPEAPDAIPARSERYDIPGNAGLGAAERDRRRRLVYDPFCAAVTAMLERARPWALVTLHSFTPVYLGAAREVEIGILHDSDARLADVLLAQDWNGWRVARNQPYGPIDGVTHSLKRHALPRGLLNVMIEIRSDLIETEAQQRSMSGLLGRHLSTALERIAHPVTETGS